MNKTIYSSFILLFFICMQNFCVFSQTNDFYDDQPTIPLGDVQIKVEGEIEQPYHVDFTKLPLRSVIVKEAVLDSEGDHFIGAYRYDGYSLYDILNEAVLKKANQAEFPPVIDLFVEVEGVNGDKAIFSWGEIYYPIHRHEIIIATQISRIVPSKTKDYWPLPGSPRVVAAADLHSHRYIENPKSIKVRSWNRPFVKHEEAKFTNKISLEIDGEKKMEIVPSSLKPPISKYSTVFYGRGRGIHGISTFEGKPLKNLLSTFFKINPQILMEGLLIVYGIDGYRSVFSCAEVMDRNDQEEILLVFNDNLDNPEAAGFRIFPACDFFSDRAVKAIEKIEVVFK
ncbi:MAG: hypothetical protein KBF06_02375 [Bacteroidales bacterium]|nr:hypothetical protein [Bacteroidales bacterium]MBP9511316.1 hypothetical protein [Bacteroidales bacterium]MBP9588171.1 hypothetical protein [Bacteroidales bacterium]MDI9573244.1 hypothetical protein [Bacteroidota bacterium]HQF18426.1 hypothetical protein [Bacteroidales bacterium]